MRARPEQILFRRPIFVGPKSWGPGDMEIVRTLGPDVVAAGNIIPSKVSFPWLEGRIIKAGAGGGALQGKSLRARFIHCHLRDLYVAHYLDN